MQTDCAGFVQSRQSPGADRERTRLWKTHDDSRTRPGAGHKPTPASITATARCGCARRCPTARRCRRCEGAARADVAIAGGGFVGLWTAIRIKQRDPACDVVVLEQDICGGGASGRNGGMVLSWWPKLASLVDRVRR